MALMKLPDERGESFLYTQELWVLVCLIGSPHWPPWLVHPRFSPGSEVDNLSGVVDPAADLRFLVRAWGDHGRRVPIILLHAPPFPAGPKVHLPEASLRALVRAPREYALIPLHSLLCPLP